MKQRQLLGTGLLMLATVVGIGFSAFATDDPQVVAGRVAAAQAADAALADKVETVLRSDFGLVGSRLRIASDSAVITVAGTVPDEPALRRALDLASGVRGVREVHNAMEVEPPK